MLQESIVICRIQEENSKKSFREERAVKSTERTKKQEKASRNQAVHSQINEQVKWKV